MDQSIQSSKIASSRSDSSRPDPGRHDSDRRNTELDDWMHDFRNALGNVTIAASAAKAELADHRSESATALMRQIEEGCERCLRLLKTMPR